jgi:hypothetical protein
MKPAKLYFPDYQDHPGDIKYLILSGVECQMFPDVAGIVTEDVPQLFPVVSRPFPDQPGRLPGLCRDIN